VKIINYFRTKKGRKNIANIRIFMIIGLIIVYIFGEFIQEVMEEGRLKLE